MRSFGAAALFTLAIITECFGAHSDRSRSRSGPIRSVPVAADVKRDVDFDCPEEFGYYPHPTDCTLYYVCVFGGALLESCTGGLMYSHELQTCDWPRNVGCDGTSTGGEEVERVVEQRQRDPPRPPPRRTPPPPPPPPPRAQPNPVITSRGQPRYSQQEYEKQQQLYAEVDDLPPVEEIESDRQQRVYRGQPPTIGQVQKDRDGYAVQQVSSGRNLNSNIIPASIPQNSGKIGSFSFGSQVDDRRSATVTPAPQSYSLEPTESVAPQSYSPSPRPKMLYNGSQNYSPDQYDPFYAVYDEDGELYKDTDYVQQYNTASLRPAVQQTYRGTPPPSRKPVETYTPRPLPEEYDDELIQPQINNQNQYQTPIRHSTRGEGNELGYDHNPSSVRTTLYEATTLSTTPPTTTSTSTTTQRPTTAPYTEAMTPSRYTPRPTSTRGRGSAHYSTAGGSDSQAQPAPNRGTPPTRSRPTLKPSTAIVSETTKFTDVYLHPPSRPAPVYPQPTPDKTAAKCRKDVCLLPDCYCGGKDIPGDLPVDQIPQIVLLTFDDSVNDLNKGLYADLFEKGRVNPNGCPISATFYVSHEWTDYSQVQNLYSAGHEMASHTISHSFGEQFSQKKWYREVGGQREILAAYGGVKLEDVRGMRAPFLSVGGNKMFKMLHDANFTYDSSLPVYENRPPSWPYTLDYKLFHDCMIPPCPTKSYPGVWEVPMVMWQDLNGGRCSMGDACANPPEPENVYKMILKNFDRHYTTNRAPFGLFYHAAWFTQPHHKEGFIMFLDFINQMPDVWIVTNWQALQWVRDPTPINRLNNFQPFQCNYQDRPKKCNHPKVCNLWHKSGVRYMRTCQPCPEVYPWTGKSGIRSSRIDNDIGE